MIWPARASSQRLSLCCADSHGDFANLSHTPALEVAKGEPRKPYEFGHKLGLLTTAREQFSLGALASHHRPFGRPHVGRLCLPGGNHDGAEDWRRDLRGPGL